MALPGVETHLGVAPPVFLRKLARKSHWGIDADPISNRVDEAVERLFPEPGGVFSVFCVESDVDLRRIAFALNANRGSFTERLDLIAFTASELERSQITLESVPELGTRCEHANRRHCHILAGVDQLRALCESAMQAGRRVASLTTATMREVIKAAEGDGCRILTADSATDCACQQG